MITDDDWMNPKTRGHIWTNQPHPDGTFYLISRKKRIPVSGNVSYIEQWDVLEEFDNKNKRDTELANLRAKTNWIVRADQVTYFGGHVVPGSNPRDLIDV